MARILLTWELGGGLGHLMNLKPIAAGLMQRGHQVFLAVKDLSRVRQVIDCSNITLLAAPWNTRGSGAIQQIVTYADLLLNVGFADVDSLTAHVAAWRAIFDFVKPNLMICDHSPTALLAARGHPFRIATVGTGFFCPPDESPLRLLREVKPEDVPAVRQRELRLLDNINRVLSNLPSPLGKRQDEGAGNVLSDTLTPTLSQRAREHVSLPHLDRVTQLYHNEQVKHFLLTFKELDHFTGRGEATYWGAWPYGLGGQPFVRPPGRDPCLFGYLKPFPALEEVLKKLSEARISSIVYVDGLKEEDKAKYRSDRLVFADVPIDIRQAAENCDVALTNANPGTCTAMLLAGKPLVNVPAHLEQSMFAAAPERLGASVTAPVTDASAIARAINQVLGDRRFRKSAAAFAAKYRDFLISNVERSLLKEIELML